MSDNNKFRYYLELRLVTKSIKKGEFRIED